MIDFHSHIVFNVDDGADNVENSIVLLKKAEKVGFESIILTPHYMENYFENNTNHIKEKIEKLKYICNKEKINIKLYQANEIYITNNIIELIKNNIATTINNSRYILIELPINHEPPNLLEVIYKLLKEGRIPIIAHPERYSYIHENPNKLIELIEKGVLFQSNYGSIIGQYGRETKKIAKILIKNNFIHFLGTDIHKENYIYDNIDKIKKELKKLLSEEEIEDLTTKNAKKVLRNEEIQIVLPNKIKQRDLFKKFILY